MASYFTDPDDDALTYNAVSSDIEVAAVAVSGSVATVTGVAAGAATVTVTATDAGGLSAQQSVAVTVPNRAPVAADKIPDQHAVAGVRVWAVPVAGSFADPDGDSLALGATTSDAAVVSVVGGSASSIDLYATGAGEAVVTVTATDPGGLSAELSFGVGVEPDPLPALAQLYGAAGGSEWINADSWLTDAPLGQWYGVRAEARANGEVVTALALADNGMNGTIPAELGDLVSLTSLRLEHNALAGPIPLELGNLPSLEWLYLHHNDLTGPVPPELGNLASLEYLALSTNALSGSIPPELANASRLVHLSLHNNTLTGALPPELVGMVKLEYLALDSSDHCAPADARLREWLDQLGVRWFPCLPTVADPYPIRLHWTHCRDKSTYEGCVPVSDPRAKYGDMVVDAMNDVAAEWARILHPTPRTSWVAPVEGWDRNWARPASLWGFEPGDTIPPGLDVVVGSVDNCRGGRGWTCATASHVQPPGQRLYPPRLARVAVDPEITPYDSQYWVSLHEMGHALAGLGRYKARDEWADHVVSLPLDSAQRETLGLDTLYLQTHPEVVATYNRFGGGAWDWIGKDVGIPIDRHGHWHWCVVPQDVMSGWYYSDANDGSERTWITPLTAVAARIYGGFMVDSIQVRSADYHVPHYWDRRECRVLATTARSSHLGRPE